MGVTKHRNDFCENIDGDVIDFGRVEMVLSFGNRGGGLVNRSKKIQNNLS